MTSIRFSIVVPVFDAAGFVGALLDSIPCPPPAGFEVIVVDDHSRDATLAVIERHALRPWLALLQTPRNSGPAAARNLGAARASGRFLLFLDADVALLPDTLAKVERYVDQHPEVRCASGLDAPASGAPGWVPGFHALWAHHTLDRLPEGAAASAWNPRNGLLERALFEELGGFDTRYKRADVEDYALSRKIAVRTPIRFTRALEVVHRFGGLRTSTAAYFRRSAYWVRLAAETGEVDRTGHTRVANLPSVACSAAIVAALAVAPVAPLAARAIPLLVAVQALLAAPLLRYFVTRAGLVRGVAYLGLLIHFQAVAALGGAVGAAQVALERLRHARVEAPPPVAEAEP